MALSDPRRLTASPGFGDDDARANLVAVQGAIRNLESVLAAGADAGAVGLRDVAIMFVNEIKRTLSHPGTGRAYRRGKKMHIASSPGDPPAVDVGRLRSSIAWRAGEDEQRPYVEVGTNVVYAAFLEFGTRFMAARPWLRPAIERLIPQVGTILSNAITRAQSQAIAHAPKAAG